MLMGMLPVRELAIKDDTEVQQSQLLQASNASDRTKAFGYFPDAEIMKCIICMTALFWMVSHLII